jgi:hypothetical protein
MQPPLYAVEAVGRRPRLVERAGILHHERHTQIHVVGELPVLHKDRADGIENLAARAMADDMRLAAQVINRLIEEIGTAAATTNGAIAGLVDLVGGQ